MYKSKRSIRENIITSFVETASMKTVTNYYLFDSFFCLFVVIPSGTTKSEKYFIFILKC